jgi:hypothetical protein
MLEVGCFSLGQGVRMSVSIGLQLGPLYFRMCFIWGVEEYSDSHPRTMRVYRRYLGSINNEPDIS